jgi:hypothetical protein
MTGDRVSAITSCREWTGAKSGVQNYDDRRAEVGIWHQSFARDADTSILLILLPSRIGGIPLRHANSTV